jgi:deazaflavin-dependent oxidoreductase (nitroreductase family)
VVWALIERHRLKSMVRALSETQTKAYGTGTRVIPDLNELAELDYLYLTTVGRITGQPREIEIWFVEYQGSLYILAEHSHNAQWVRNIERNPRVQVRLGTGEFEATARVLTREHDDATWVTVQRLAQEKYGWGAGLPVEIITDE